ncbi:unnamed protein product [Symbiodinium sp. CCMP2456]|nr:unnamed protein product [Symbiodinium sp. CCMP2456]
MDAPLDMLLNLIESAAGQTLQSVIIATDGSSRDGIGSYAIVCDQPRVRCAGADASEDQTPFRMELLALETLLGALSTVRRPSSRWQTGVPAACGFLLNEFSVQAG